MGQKLDIGLVSLLLNGPSHARALARSLGVNPMTVARRLQALVAGNVLDYEVSGRNKVFHIKRSLEARNAVAIAEFHRLDLLLSKYPALRRIVSRIQEDRRFALAVIFGSYAKGTATKASDIDVFVETRDPAVKHDLERLGSRMSVKIGEYDRESALIKELERDHVIIKGVEIYCLGKYERDRLISNGAAHGFDDMKNPLSGSNGHRRPILIPKDKIAVFCKRNHIRKMSLFGSVLRGEERPDSDIDLLVEFEPGHVPGLITLSGMELELTGLLGRKVDLRTPGDLSRYFRKEVLDEAEALYAEG
jgi:predicted nucleotidyltransferase